MKSEQEKLDVKVIFKNKHGKQNNTGQLFKNSDYEVCGSN
jgi:hypothetical protein